MIKMLVEEEGEFTLLPLSDMVERLAQEYEDEEDDEEEEEQPIPPSKLRPVCYEIVRYKNEQGQQLDQSVEVVGYNLSIVPLSETQAALVVVNENGQATYTTNWTLVKEVRSKPHDETSSAAPLK